MRATPPSPPPTPPSPHGEPIRPAALFDRAGLTAVTPVADAAPPVLELTDDSRAVAPGWLYIARGPWSARSEGFALDALERGAAALVLPARAWNLASPLAQRVQQAGVAVALAPDIDQALAGRIADHFFGQPAQRLRLVGITGTNGKTTVALLTQHLLRAAGFKPGLLGTVYSDVGDPQGPTPAELTTPGAIELRRLFADMVRHGCDACAMEVSSHALDQGRVAGLTFDAAVFTNLTQDHLDYHGTMDDYADAKARLFTMLGTRGWAIVNADDPASPRLVAGLPPGRVLWTRVGTPVDATPERIIATAQPEALDADGSTARFNGPWGSASARLPLVGEHNLSNALQAAAAVHTLARMSARELRERLAACPPVPGRLEPVRLQPPVGPTVLVDYAHTPDALQRVASTLAPLTHQRGGRLIVVYGCGGDRDRTKRPRMTAAALQYADRAVLTSDNPRSEDPQRILDDATAGLSDQDRARLHVEPDRAAAIRAAVAAADASDTVLLAGKGHEDYQILADPPGQYGGATRKIHFDDREHAAEALQHWQPPAVAC